MHQVLPGFWCRRLEAAAVGICPVTAIGQLNPRQLAVLVLILPGSVIGGCARQPTIGVVKSDLAAIAGADPGGLPKAVVVNLNRVAMPVLNPTGQKIEMVTLQVVGQPLAITFQGPDQLGGGAIDGNIKIIMHAFARSEEHTSELQSRGHLVCRLLLEKKKRTTKPTLDIQKRS